MAVRKMPDLSPEQQAAIEEDHQRWKKEKRRREQNNEKQKRFREGMKAEGYKQVLLWSLPCPDDVRKRMAAADFRQCVAWEKRDKASQKDGTIKIAAVIRETSLYASVKSPEIQKALTAAAGSFF